MPDPLLFGEDGDRQRFMFKCSALCQHIRCVSLLGATSDLCVCFGHQFHWKGPSQEAVRSDNRFQAREGQARDEWKQTVSDDLEGILIVNSELAQLKTWNELGASLPMMWPPLQRDGAKHPQNRAAPREWDVILGGITTDLNVVLTAADQTMRWIATDPNVIFQRINS
eukprot:gene15169-4528_t